MNPRSTHAFVPLTLVVVGVVAVGDYQRIDQASASGRPITEVETSYNGNPTYKFRMYGPNSVVRGEQFTYRYVFRTTRRKAGKLAIRCFNGKVPGKVNFEKIIRKPVKNRRYKWTRSFTASTRPKSVQEGDWCTLTVLSKSRGTIGDYSRFMPLLDPPAPTPPATTETSPAPPAT